MRYFFILYLFIYPAIAQASFVASLGIEGTEPQKSNQKNDEGRALISHRNLIGPKAELEYHFFKVLSLTSSLQYAASKAEIQYQYTNPHDERDEARVDDQAGSIGLLRLGLGGKLQLLKMKHFQMFVGGGGILGRMFLSYDREEFRIVTGSTTGFKEKENQAIRGSYYEAGMDFLFKNNFGLRVMAQRAFLKSESFETMANQRVTMAHTFTSLALTYQF